MAIVTERIEENVLYLELNGRIDSSNADQAEAEINTIKAAHPELPYILDAEKLDVDRCDWKTPIADHFHSHGSGGRRKELHIKHHYAATYFGCNSFGYILLSQDL